MFVGIVPHPSMVPSLTGARLSAVDHVLDRQISRWPHSFPLDVDAILTRQRKGSHKCNICFGKSLKFIEMTEDPICYFLSQDCVEKIDFHNSMSKWASAKFKSAREILHQNFGFTVCNSLDYSKVRARHVESQVI